MIEHIKALRAGNDGIETFRALHKAWGNDFSLRPVSLMLAFKMACRSDDPFVETGSGLSSIVLGLAAERRNVSVTTIESDAEHAKITQAALDDAGIFTVGVNHCPLDDKGLPTNMPGIPARVGFWLHDGPMSFDGRTAIFPLLADQIRHARIMVDDIGAPGYLDHMVAALRDTHRITTIPDAAGVALCVPRSTSDQG